MASHLRASNSDGLQPNSNGLTPKKTKKRMVNQVSRSSNDTMKVMTKADGLKTSEYARTKAKVGGHRY